MTKKIRRARQQRKSAREMARELAIEDPAEFARRALAKPRITNEWMEAQRRAAMSFPDDLLAREYELAIEEIAHQEIRRLTSINPSGQDLTYEMLVEVAESLNVPMPQPQAWNGGVQSLNEFVDIRPEPMPFVPYEFQEQWLEGIDQHLLQTQPKWGEKSAAIVDLALQHHGILVNSFGMPLKDSEMLQQEALKIGHLMSWKRTQPLNKEIVKSAILTMYANMYPLRVVFVKGPLEMLKFLHTMPIRMDGERWGTRSFRIPWRGMRQQQPDQELLNLIGMSCGMKYASSDPSEPIATFCHAWKLLSDHLPSSISRTLLIMDYPRVLQLDSRDRAHCVDGPAVAYADGSSFYAWHGIKLEARHINREYGYKDILDEPNAEVRRAMVELYGAEKYIKDCGAQCVQSDAVGKLWVAPADPFEGIRNDGRFNSFRAISEAESRLLAREISMWGDRPEMWDGRGGLPEISFNGRVRRNNAIVFVEVLNSTPEPDGTIKTYWLRVPPDTLTAKAGIAWTFGLTADEYNPEVQT